MNKSQLAILAAINSKPSDPEPVGWFRPNDPRLIPTLNNVRLAGKGVAAVTAENGFIFLYAIERPFERSPEQDRGKWGAGPFVGLRVAP